MIGKDLRSVVIGSVSTVPRVSPFSRASDRAPWSGHGDRLGCRRIGTLGEGGRRGNSSSATVESRAVDRCYYLLLYRQSAPSMGYCRWSMVDGRWERVLASAGSKSWPFPVISQFFATDETRGLSVLLFPPELIGGSRKVPMCQCDALTPVLAIYLIRPLHQP